MIERMKCQKFIIVSIAMMMILAVSVAPALAASACEIPQKSIDVEEKDKILKSVSKEISLPEDYFISPAPDDTGFVLTYWTSPTSLTLVDISKNYKIKDIWNATISNIAGGRNIVMVSNTGKEMSITNADGKLTIYDSSSGNVITISIGCYEICMGSCGAVFMAGCRSGCPTICGALIVTGWGYIACVIACLAACGGLLVIDCNGLCNDLC